MPANNHASLLSVLQIDDNKNMNLVSRTVTENQVPDVVGMGIKEALYLLENIGLKVGITGTGSVSTQSIPAGSHFKKGQKIILELS
jgi:cell division protein FtsI (penicillin-binding protein 3)